MDPSAASCQSRWRLRSRVAADVKAILANGCTAMASTATNVNQSTEVSESVRTRLRALRLCVWTRPQSSHTSESAATLRRSAALVWLVACGFFTSDEYDSLNGCT